MPVSASKNNSDSAVAFTNDTLDGQIIQTTNFVLQSLLAANDFTFFAVDLNYCYLSFSESYKKLKKQVCNIDIVVGMSVFECFKKPNEKAALFNKLFKVLNGELIVFELEFGVENKSKINFENNCSPIYAANHSIIGITVLLKNKTATKQADKAKKVTESKYKTLLEQAFDGILIYNLNGKIVELNHKAYNFLGYTLNEFKQLNITDLFFENDLIKNPIDFKRLNTGKPTLDFRSLKRKDGTVAQMEINSKMLEDGNILVYGREITDRIRNQQREKKRTYILEQISNGTPFIDVLTKIVIGAEQDEIGMIASILLLDKQKKKFELSIAPSMPVVYSQALIGLQIGEGVGSCGTAAYTGKRIIIENVYKHSYWANYLNLATLANISSCWSEPILNDKGEVLGTFAIYHSIPSIPTQNDIDYIKQLADITAIVVNKNNADKELARANELLKETSELANIGGFELDVASGKFTWTDVTKEIFEVANDFVPELKNVFEFFKEGFHRSSLIEFVQQSMNNGTPFSTELIFTTQKGNERWLSIRCQAEMENGVCKRLYGIKQDITYKKNADLALQQSEEKFKSVIHNITDMVALLDATGNILYESAAITKILGFTEEELIGKNIFEFIHVDDIELARHEFSNVLSNAGFGNTIEIRFLNKSGDYTFIEARANNQLFNNAINAIVVISRDISEKKKSQLLLQQKDKYFSTLIKYSSTAIILLDEHAKVIYRSPAVHTIFGYTFDEVNEDTSVFDLIHPDDKKSFYNQFISCTSAHGKTESGIYRFQHKKGHYIWLEGAVTNFLTEHAINALVANFYEVTDRILAQEKIINERALLRTLIDNLPEAIYVKDINGRKLIANTEDVAFMGLHNEAEALGKTDIEIYNNATGEYGHFIDKKIIQTGNSIINKEEFYIDENGYKRWLLTSKIALHNNAENITGMVGISRDITERKQTEEALLKSNERFEYATKATFDALWDWDFENNTYYLGEGFNTLFGYDSKNGEGQNVTKLFIHPEDKERVLLSIDEAIANTATNWNEEYRFLKANGTYAFVHNKAIIIRDEMGKATRLIGAMQDITNQKMYTQKIIEAENKFRALVENSNDGVAILNTDGNPLYIAPSIQNILGYTEEEAMKMNIFSITHPDDADEVLKVFKKVFENPGIPIKGYTSRMLHKDGTWRWLEDTITNMLHEPAINGIVENFRDITEKITIENNILAEKELSEFIINSLPGIFYMYTTDGNFIKWNNNFEQVTGYTKDEIILMNPSNFYDEENKYNFSVRVNNIIKGTQPDTEIFFKQKNGNKIPLFISSRYIKSDTHDFIVGIGFDISERINKEAELKKSNDRFEFAAQATFDAIWEWDVEKNELFWTKNFETIFGYNSNNLKQNLQTRNTNIVADDAEKIISSINKALNSNAHAWAEDYRLKKQDGSVAFVQDKAVIVRNETGEAIKMIGALQDITQKVMAQNQLKLYESIVKNTNDGILVISAKENDYDDNVIQYVNNAFCKLTDYTEAEIIGKSYQFFEGKDTAIEESYKLGLALANCNAVEIEIIYYNKSAQPFWVNISLSPLLETNGKPMHFIGVIKDITSRKQADENLNHLNRQLAERAVALKDSNNELERFAYVASHDLQEPLRMVSSFLKLLEKKYNPVFDDTGKKYINFAVDGAERMKKLILDLLDYSRIGTNKEIASVTDMNMLVDELKQTFYVTINELSAQIITNKLPILPNTRKTLLFQLLQNLIGNALKYHSTNAPIITINAEEQHYQWLFSVADNGIGIKKIFAEKIFVIFQRLHSKDDYEGTGIGLSICKKIVEMHGGKIWVESEFGKGATFYFSIKK